MRSERGGAIWRCSWVTMVPFTRKKSRHRNTMLISWSTQSVDRLRGAAASRIGASPHDRDRRELRSPRPLEDGHQILDLRRRGEHYGARAGAARMQLVKLGDEIVQARRDPVDPDQRALGHA